MSHQDARLEQLKDWIKGNREGMTAEQNCELAERITKDAWRAGFLEALSDFEEYIPLDLAAQASQFIDKRQEGRPWFKAWEKMPKITPEKPFVEVRVRMTGGGVGRMMFGSSGAMGEPISGSFAYPIRDFVGDIGLGDSIYEWQSIEEEE